MKLYLRPMALRDRYKRIRGERTQYRGYRAFEAWQFAKHEERVNRFYQRLDSVSADRWRGTPSEGTFEEQELDTGRALRIELEWIADSDAERGDSSVDDWDALKDYTRNVLKLGKTQARECAREIIRAQLDAQERAQANEWCGVVCRVYWRGALVGEDSCWGYEYADFNETYQFAQEIACNALHTARRQIREDARKVRAFAREFGFSPWVGYQPK